MTDPPPNRSLSITQQSAYLSPFRRYTRARPSDRKRLKLDSSENRTLFHNLRGNRWRCWHHSTHALRCLGVRIGRIAGRRFSILSSSDVSGWCRNEVVWVPESLGQSTQLFGAESLNVLSGSSDPGGPWSPEGVRICACLLPHKYF